MSIPPTVQIVDYFRERHGLASAHITELYRRYSYLVHLSPAAYALLSTISRERGVEYKGTIHVEYNRDRLGCLRCTLSNEPPPTTGPIKRSVFCLLFFDGSSGHANCLIVDHKTKIIRQYEPHGTEETFYDDYNGFMNRVMLCVEKKISTMFGGDYTMQWHTDSALYCPYLGPQSHFDIGEGVCTLHALYRACLDMWNPNVESQVMDTYIDILVQHGRYEYVLVDVLYTMRLVVEQMDLLIDEPKKLPTLPNNKDLTPVFRNLLRAVPSHVIDIALEIAFEWDNIAWMEKTIHSMKREDRLRLLDRTVDLLVINKLDTAGTTEALKVAITRDFSPTFQRLLLVDVEFQVVVVLNNPTFRVECDDSLLVIGNLYAEGQLSTDELTMILNRGPAPEDRCISDEYLEIVKEELPPELHHYFYFLPRRRSTWLSWLIGSRDGLSYTEFLKS